MDSAAEPEGNLWGVGFFCWLWLSWPAGTATVAARKLAVLASLPGPLFSGLGRFCRLHVVIVQLHGEQKNPSMRWDIEGPGDRCSLTGFFRVAYLVLWLKSKLALVAREKKERLGIGKCTTAG